MREYPYEVAHVGRAIQAHREDLAVTLSELIAAGGAGTDQLVKFTERSPHPRLTLIERHHRALMGAWVNATKRIPAPMARREQWYTTDQDYEMWRAAMAASPSVTWWWAARTGLGGRGAWCYLCTAMIHTYDVGRGLTSPARTAVMAHRYKHTLYAPYGALKTDQEHAS